MMVIGYRRFLGDANRRLGSTRGHLAAISRRRLLQRRRVSLLLLKRSRVPANDEECEFCSPENEETSNGDQMTFSSSVSRFFPSLM